MSTQPIPEVAQLTSSPSSGGTAAAVAPPAAAASTGGAASADEEQEILAALNSRALTRGRDLVLSVDGNDGFLLSSASALASPQGFTLTLNHQ
ncbi:MAG: hypothetical protein HYV63_30125 [Candidatus Schekmanbacteria bacterium]|nr:hypothetical protein [Candidatus Schekmanbacteria bacterium]